MRKSKLVLYYEELIRKAKLKLSRAEQDYIESCKATVLFAYTYNYVNKELQDKEMERYKHFSKVYFDLLKLEETLLSVKGCEGASYEQ